MSERNHSAPLEQAATLPDANAGHKTANSPAASNTAAERKRKWAILAAGSLGIVLIGGILFQIFQAESGQAGAQNAPAANEDGQSTALARVDGNVITWRQVADECVARHGKEILDNLINRTIIQQACAERKIVVTNTEVANEVRRIAAKFKLEPENWYQMLQAERGISPLQYHRDIIWPMLALKKIAGTKVTVTKEELQKAFTRDYGPRVKARIIMLDNLRRARDVHAQVIRNPNDFGRIAQKHSIEPNSRALGGEIPPIPRYGGNEKLEEAAFRLKKDEISPVVQIGFNRFVILMSDGRTEQKIENIREVYEELHSRLVEEKTQTNVAQVFEKLRREARVDNFMTNTSTGIKQASGTKAGKTRIRGQYPPRPGVAKRRTPTIK